MVANYKADDPLHKSASKIARGLNKKGYKYYCLNLVVQDSTTVISKKMDMGNSKRFYLGLKNFVDIFVEADRQLEIESWKIFLAQTKKGTSFVDCANMAAIKKYGFDGILSFDKFYPRELRM